MKSRFFGTITRFWESLHGPGNQPAPAAARLSTIAAGQPGTTPRASNSEQSARARVSSPPLQEENFDAQLNQWVSQGEKGERRTSAATRITACREGLNRELDLSNLNIKNLPQCIGELTALRRLDLSSNELTALPGNIANLTALEELSLTFNQLTIFPNCVTQLQGLEKLDLSFNNLTKLPESIVSMTALTELDLSFNQLTAISSRVGDLTALTQLDLSFNHLSTLPESVGNLPALRKLELAENPVTTPSFDSGSTYLSRQIARIRDLRARPMRPTRRVTFAPLPQRDAPEVAASSHRQHPHSNRNVPTPAVSLSVSRPIEAASAPVVPSEQDDKNFQALCHSLAEASKKLSAQATMHAVRANGSGIPCNAFNNVNVLVGRGDQEHSVSIHANEVKVTLFKKRKRVPANWVYLAGQSPVSSPSVPEARSPSHTVPDPQAGKFEACEQFLVQGIQSGQGLYQFVSRAAHYGPYKPGVSTKEQPIIAQLEAFMRQPNRHFGERYTNLTMQINQNPRGNHDEARKEFQQQLRPYLALDANGSPHPALLGGRYLIDKFERVPGHNKQINKRKDDHMHYLLTVIDCSTTPPSARTVPVTQAGLKFSNSVLAQKEIERADEILGQHIGLWSEHDPSTLQKDWVAGVPPTPQQAPMIVSYAGIGRNATLIVYHEIMCKIKRGEIRTEQEMDREMLAQIIEGRKARGPKFIQSDDQLLTLRQSLQSELRREVKVGQHQGRRQVQEWTGSPHNHPRTGHLQHRK